MKKSNQKKASTVANIIRLEKKQIETRAWEHKLRNRKPKVTRWHAGICNKCQEFFECITYAHAELHGYKHPDEMAEKADFITWLE